MKMIKKFGKRSLATILALMMCLGLLSTTAFAAEDKSSVSLAWEVSETKFEDSSEERYVTIKLTATPHAVAPLADNCGHLYFTVDVAEELEIVSAESSQVSYNRTGNKFECFRMNNEDGHGHNYSVTDVGTITVKIPAGTPAGEYSVAVKDAHYTLWNNSTSYYSNYSWDTLCSFNVTVEGDPEPVVPDPEPEAYTFTLAEADGKTSVNVGETVTMNVTLDKPASVVEAVVTDDANVFELQSGDTTINKVNMDRDTAENETLATLTFKAIAAAENAEFGFSTARAYRDSEVTDGVNASEAQKEEATITVTNAPVTVTFNDEDGTELDTLEVAYGGSVPSDKIPTAEKAYHDFAGWNNGTTTLTADEVANAAVTEAVTYTAVYTPKTYTVTVGEGLTGEEEATYGTAYTGTIENFDGDNYTYTVKYAIDGVEAEATVDDEGNYTIEGSEIKGDMTIAVEKIPAFGVELHADYITGYTLVLVRTNDNKATTKGYTYGGSDMYYVERYKAYGWIVEGALTEDDAKAQVGIGTKSGDVLNRGTDVNNSGTTDIVDTAAVIGCYRGSYDLVTNMARYLSADVSGDTYKVDVNDVAAVQAAYSAANP